MAFNADDLERSLTPLVSSPEEAAQVVAQMKRAASWGMAVDPKTKQPAFPWALLLNGAFVESLGPEILDQLGITAKANAASLREKLTRFGTPPEILFEPRTATWLTDRRGYAKKNQSSGGHDIPDAPQKVKPVFGTWAVDAAKALAAEEACLRAVQVSVDLWGFNLCWDQACAEGIGRALAGPAAGAIVSAIMAAIDAGGLGSLTVSVVIAWLGGTIGAAIIGTALAYGAWMAALAVGCSKGVCIRVFWPLPFPLTVMPPIVHCR